MGAGKRFGVVAASGLRGEGVTLILATVVGLALYAAVMLAISGGGRR